MTFLPDLAERLADVARRGRIPGAAIAVRQGDMLAEAATGILNVSTGVEATTDSLFHVGSVTKMYTALLVMQLVEEGLVDLDAPVRRYLPDFRLADERAAAALTTRHLLTHTGGFDGDLFEDTGRGDDSIDRYLDVVAGARQWAAPGELFSYCNSGFVVLGALVARLRTGTWESVVRERLLDPMSLDHTTLYPEEAIVFRVAAGHFEDPQTQELKVGERWAMHRALGPAFSVVSAAPRDVARFGQLFLDGTSIISAMTAQAVPAVNGTLVRQWGLGVMIYDFGGPAVWGHSGNHRGQSCYLRIVPEHDLVIAASGNVGGALLLSDDLVDGLVTELTGARPPSLPVPPRTPSHVDVAPLVGSYQGQRETYQVEATDDGVSVTEVPSGEGIREGEVESTVRYVHYDGDMFLTAEPMGGDHPTITFVDGGRFLHNGRAHPRVS
ncbi:serine hydrolase [Longispora fulva]|uniref:CubicO group peptidase (Beta-lactamase class C family) n=1 Tax=Longispora fulva TaxID=619741 RepID=A0A8J7KWM1_9ACTN|nr:serine hydrolase domain-containing protein [Longispora fulva]MBG6136727.1 CubicO group peptidase (beta-lactamase class C family) [Longispora fulva]GIG59897.1 serine hydrolase [Longispora fulva]